MNLTVKLLLSIISFLVLQGCGGGGGSTTTQATSTTSTIGNDNTAPVFTTADLFSLRENHVVVTTVQAEDTSSVTYTLAGTDAADFLIDSTLGTLKFKTAANFESPTDQNSDNRYEITVIATDTSNNQAQQDINITVSDIDETLTGDSDNDFISDNIETLLQSNINDSDVNNNGVDDGLDTEGIYGDTFFDKQWHIRSLGTATNDSGVDTILGNDLNLLAIYNAYMGYNRGENIIVQVVDTGIDADHEDLVENMDLTRSYKNASVGDPSGTNTHGTMVAGIMAARAFNGKGVRGIIPFAKIAGSDWLRQQSIAALDKIWLSGAGANEIAVSNNSWGSYFDTDTVYEDLMEQGVNTLRDGKGRVYVFPAGNDRDTLGDANLQYLLSNRYAMTVAALAYDNTYAVYSSPGSNILVSGYAGNYYQDDPTISTTTIMGRSSNTGDINSKTTWTEDTAENYTFVMNGTSAASPTVAASLALVLEACPNLTWRDIRYLTATHAIQVDSGNTSWKTNAAGLVHSVDYGYGLVNPQGMIDDCSNAYSLLQNERITTTTANINTLITDDNTPFTFDLTITNNITIEWVEVTINNNNRSASDYRIKLRSPQNTETTLIIEKSDAPAAWMDGGFRFGSAAFIDEMSQGTWQVSMSDNWAGDSGTVRDIQIKVYGH